MSTVALCLTLHLASGGAILARLLPSLPDALRAGSNPAHLLAMEPGLRRLLVVDVLLPPVVPTLTALLVWATIRSAAIPLVWMTVGLLPHAVERLAQAATVVASAPPRTIADVFTIPGRFSSGAVPILDRLGATPSPSARYWLGTLTIAAGVSIYCWGRALAVAVPSRHPRAGRERAFDADAPPDLNDVGTYSLVVAVVYAALALVVQLTTPLAVRLFLGLVG